MSKSFYQNTPPCLKRLHLWDTHWKMYRWSDMSGIYFKITQGGYRWNRIGQRFITVEAGCVELLHTIWLVCPSTCTEHVHDNHLPTGHQAAAAQCEQRVSSSVRLVPTKPACTGRLLHSLHFLIQVITPDPCGQTAEPVRLSTGHYWHLRWHDSVVVDPLNVQDI